MGKKIVDRKKMALGLNIFFFLHLSVVYGMIRRGKKQTRGLEGDIDIEWFRFRK